MDIQEILQQQTDPATIIAELKKKRGSDQPDTDKFKKMLDPSKHDVCDPALRPKKKVRLDKDEDDTARTIISTEEAKAGFRLEEVARISVALQKLIVSRAVAFIFGRLVQYLAEVVKGSNEEKVLTAVKTILKDNKEKSLNRKLAREVFSCTEAAEIWYPVAVDKTETGTGIIARVKDAVNNFIGNKYHEKYGFKSKYKLRYAIFSPLLGDILWPYFDETGDLVAFSREFTRTDENKVDHKYFETYTDSEQYMWELDTDGYKLVQGYPKPIQIGKIPVIYAKQPEVEWADVQNLIDRLEKLLSNFGDTNDYHASPKIFTKGEIKGFSKKGESGIILQGDENSDVKVVSWEHAPESVKLEIETLLKLIYTITQTPDISFDALKGLGDVSGIALKLLFMDAHLKVASHQELFDEFLQRRVNVIKAFVAQFNFGLKEAAKNIEIDPAITPYMIDDEMSDINKWMSASGGKPVIAHKTAIIKAGLVTDPDAEYELIQEESDRERQFMIGEPTA